MSVKVYIDGQEGTTGLKILERFKDRNDIEIMKIDEDKRKDNDERKKFICSSDFTFLCLPDAAAREAVELAKGSNVRIIDASTAHRTKSRLGIRFSRAFKAAQRKDCGFIESGCSRLLCKRFYFACISACEGRHNAERLSCCRSCGIRLQRSGKEGYRSVRKR